MTTGRIDQLTDKLIKVEAVEAVEAGVAEVAAVAFTPPSPTCQGRTLIRRHRNLDHRASHRASHRE